MACGDDTKPVATRMLRAGVYDRPTCQYDSVNDRCGAMLVNRAGDR